MQHSRIEGKTAKQQIEAKVQAMEGLQEMTFTIGKLTSATAPCVALPPASMQSTAVLVGHHLDPRQFPTARSFLKALGLNLKEKSSGQFQGRLKLSKRGSSTARKYLFLGTALNPARSGHHKMVSNQGEPPGQNEDRRRFDA